VSDMLYPRDLSFSLVVDLNSETLFTINRMAAIKGMCSVSHRCLVIVCEGDLLTEPPRITSVCCGDG
jgi:hypothetical protein